MAAQAGEFLTGTGAIGTTVAVSGVGFKPTCVLFFGSGLVNGSDAIGAGDYFLCFGAAAGVADEFYIANYGRVTATPTVTAQAVDNDGCVAFMISSADVVDGILKLQSFDSDGFTLEVVNAFATTRNVHYLAINPASATVLQITEPAGAGNQAIGGAGFQPEAVIFAGSDLTALGGGANVSQTIGAALSSSSRFTLYFGARDNVSPPISKRYHFDGECIAVASSGGATIDSRADFVSMDADGFTIDWLESATARLFFALCLAGGKYFIGDVTARADAVPTAETGLGFTPDALMFLSAYRFTNAFSTQDVADAHLGLSVGMGTGPASRFDALIWDEDNNTGTGRAQHNAAVFQSMTTAEAEDGRMDLVSMDADGFTFVMDNAQATATPVSYLAFQNAGIGNQIMIFASEIWDKIHENRKKLGISDPGGFMEKNGVLQPGPIIIPELVPA